MMTTITPRTIVTIEVFIAFGFGIFIGCMLMNDTIIAPLRRQAIEYNYAQHNPKTGAWEWRKPAGAD